jgi:hypothetical protein
VRDREREVEKKRPVPVPLDEAKRVGGHEVGGVSPARRVAPRVAVEVLPTAVSPQVGRIVVVRDALAEITVPMIEALAVRLAG